MKISDHNRMIINENSYHFTAKANLIFGSFRLGYTIVPAQLSYKQFTIECLVKKL